MLRNKTNSSEELLDAATMQEFERRRAELALKEAEEKYRSIFENAVHGIIQTSPSGQFLNANPAFARILGYDSPADLLSTVTDIGTQIYANPADRKHFMEVLTHNDSGSLEYLAKKKDGSLVWLFVSARRVKDSFGVLRYFESIAEDVTERRRTERALAASEERLQLALDASRMGIWDLDLSSKIFVFEGVALTLFGLDPLQLPHGIEDLYTQIVPEDVERVRSALHHAVETFAPYRDEFRVQWLDGSIHWLSVRGKVIPTEARSNRLVGTVLEITARKKAEEARRRSEEDLRTFKFLSDKAHDAFFLINRRAEFLYVNPAALTLLGLSDAQLMQKKFFELCDMPSEKFAGFFEPFGTFPLQAEEAELYIQDGTKVPVDMSFSAFELNSEPHLFVVARDIRERKEAENALKQHADELARSNRELEQFAYVSSHDLKEPLRMVTVFVEMLKKHLEGKLDAESEEYIGYVVQGSRRMLNLINDLLMYSRVGKELDPFVEVNCNDVVKTAMENLLDSLRESEAQVTVGTLPQFYGNPTQLVQLFQNLIGNALKFRGGEKPQIDVSAKLEGTKWVFQIKDNGIGISERYLTKIFTLFQRLHSSSKYPGTGIGLTICKRIVESHGGEIWAESAEGKGTSFFFTIPQTEISELGAEIAP